MTIIETVRSRRSEHVLQDPAPDNELLLTLLEAAATAPDHGRLRPWRMIAHRGDARYRLGAALAAEAPVERHDDLVAKAMRAPLVLTAVLTPRDSERIPYWEQLAAAAGVIHLLTLLLHDAEFGSIWRTGAPTSCHLTERALGLRQDERLLGWLYIGTAKARRRVPRTAIDLTRHWEDVCPGDQ